VPLPGDPDWVASLPTLDAPARQSNRGLVGPGLSAGVDTLQGFGGSALQGAGKLFGLPSLETYGRGIAQNNIAEAQVNGRPDLEIAPWNEGGADVAPWLAYQATKQVPLLATYMVGGKAYRVAGGTAPKILEQAGTMVPRALGGGGALPGASFAVRRAAVEGGARDAGRRLAENFTGGSIAGLPIAFGAMVQEADQQPGGLTIDDAKKAALLSPVYSALDALEPAGLRNLFGRGQAGSIFRRVAKAAFGGAAAEVPQEGLQTALELSFRPDMSAQEKFGHIVDAAVTGGAVGGVFGAAGGIRRMKQIDPVQMGDADIAAIVDEVLGATPPTLGLPAPTMFSNAAGETAEGMAGLDELTGANRMRLPDPADIEGRSAIDGSTMVVGRNREGGRFAPGSSVVEQPPVVPEDLSRSYRNMTDPELNTAANVLADKAESKGLTPDERARAQSMFEELEFRRQNRNSASTITDVSDEVSRGGVAQPEPTAGDGGTVSAAPVPVNSTLDRDTLLKGISTRKSYSDARDAAEVETILRARLENGSTRKGDFELAKRLGIDTNAPAAPVETETSSSSNSPAAQASVATTEPAAPANQKGGDPQFLLRWKDDVQKTGQKDKGARALKPTSEADAQRQIYEALGREGEIGNGLEALAQKYGVLDDQKRLTPLAVEIAQREPIPTEEAVKAARAQGFKGAEASQFARGVKVFTDGNPTPEGGAAAAGAQWAAERNSVPRGALKKYEPRAVSDTDVALVEGTARPETRTVPLEVAQGQTVNRAIDATREGLGAAEDDVAQLKRMVREGKVEEAMDGLNRVQRGERLFQQPEREVPDFRGEVVTRGAPRAGRVGPTLVPTRAVSRAEAERAIRKFELEQAIRAAVDEGLIDNKERIRLLAKLNQGRIKEVADKVGNVPFNPLRSAEIRQLVAARKARLADLQIALEEALAAAAVESEVSELEVDENGVLRKEQVKIARRDFLAGVAAAVAVGIPTQSNAAMKFTPASQQLTDLLMEPIVRPVKVLEYLRNNSKDTSYRLLAAKLLRGDWSDVSMYLMPVDSDTARATTHTNDDGSTTITIYGQDGLNEQTILHELIHAYVMQRWGALSSYTPGKKKRLGDTTDRADGTVGQFQQLWDRIGETLMKRGLTNDQIWAQASYEDPDELLAWVLTNPDAQAYLKSIDVNGEPIKTPKPKSQQTLWDKIVEFFAELFGSTSTKVRSALDEVLSAGYAVLDAGAGVKTGDFNVKLARDMANRRAMPMAKGPPMSPPAFNDRVKDFVGNLTSAVPRESATVATRRTVFGWNTIGHLVAHYAEKFPQLALYAKAHLERRATQARWAQLFETPYQAYEQLERDNPEAAKTIRYLMSLTEFDIDPTKPWTKHEHLQGAPNEARLKELTDGANRKYNALRGKGHAKIYDDFRAINEATHLSMMSVSLYNLVATDPVLKQGMEGFETDPTDAFRERPALHESAQNAKRYWSDMLDSQVKRADEFIAQLRGETVGSASEQKLQSMRLEPIELRIKSIRESLNAMRDAPYFHLGRHGEHFVAFTLRLGEDKKTVDPAAIEHAGKLINDAGFDHIEISRDSTRPNVYVRVETIEARHQLEALARKLQKGGWLKPDSDIKAAPRSDSGNTGTADKAPAWLERYIELLQASPMFEPTDNMTADEKGQLAARRAQMVSHARELWLDMLPDTAIAKVMVHRNSVPGFDKDMIRNFAFRFQVGVNSLSNLSASAKLTDAFTQMRAAVNDAQVVGSAQHGDVDLLQSLLSETLVRESQRPLREGANWIDTWRAINHAFFLGFSPSYVMINTTQIGVLLWPELAKKHGFAKSARAIASVTKTAFNIMRETLAAGAAVGPKRALDAVITSKVLQKADGVDEGTAAFIMKAVADGWIDIGGSSRELGRVADGSVSAHLDTALRWAAAFGLYSETFTRLVATLAARKLGGDDIAYAREVTEQSMLNYSDWNTARQMGKMGFAGPMTKVMTAFMQYNAQVTEKLYREFHTAISKDATAEQKAAARRFLGGHAIAVTTLAGTLGLPFATVIAGVVEKMVDLLDDDDEPFDATAAWRNYMADIFGKDIGEIVSRGAPRGAGFDLSQRAGEQNLLPFSQFLTDKRKWREASSEAALRSMGAPVSMVLNIMEGGEKIGNGDLIGGMTSALPMSMKGPAQAYRMSDEGYVDSLGNTLPMTPGASAILAQAVGFTPQAKAEYSEARGDQGARKGVLIKRAKVLREGIIDALLEGDDDEARELIVRAQKFDSDNPAFAVLPDLASSIARRKKLQALSQATGTPIGITPKDIDGRALTGYANVEYRAQ
jgi:hypothetical protein